MIKTKPLLALPLLLCFAILLPFFCHAQVSGTFTSTLVGCAAAGTNTTASTAIHVPPNSTVYLYCTQTSTNTAATGPTQFLFGSSPDDALYGYRDTVINVTVPTVFNGNGNSTNCTTMGSVSMPAGGYLRWNAIENTNSAGGGVTNTSVKYFYLPR